MVLVLWQLFCVVLCGSCGIVTIVITILSQHFRYFPERTGIPEVLHHKPCSSITSVRGNELLTLSHDL